VTGSYEQCYELGYAFWSEVSVQSQALLTSHRSWATLILLTNGHTIWQWTGIQKIWSMQALPKWRGLMPAFPPSRLPAFPPSRPPTKLQNSRNTLTRKNKIKKFELADAFVIKE
jgi:hypothetical protein